MLKNNYQGFFFSMLAGLVLFVLGGPLLSAQSLGFRAAAEYSGSVDGVAFLVYEGDELVFEEYQKGFKGSRAHHIYSGTKSFFSALALIAQGEGLLRLDEPVAKTITEWQGDERKERITIRQLLSFTSGLKNIDRQIHSWRTADKYAAAVAGPVAAEPGSVFRYGSNHLLVFGALMKRKLLQHKGGKGADKDVLDYLNSRIFKPIGLQTKNWLRDRRGNPLLPYGAFLTAREWAKYGLLILHQGRHGKKQLIPAKHFKECFVGTRANKFYGLNWWLVGKMRRGNKLIPADTVGAFGMYNQKLYIIPSRKMVIVRFGKSPSRKRFNDRRFLTLLFTPAKKAVKKTPPAEQGKPKPEKARRKSL